MSNAYPWPALSTHTITGVVAILAAAINACRGPWMSGAFGRELSEALVFLFQHMCTTHPLLSGELHNVLLDRNLPPTHAEFSTPQAQLRIIMESPALLRSGMWVLPSSFYSSATSGFLSGPVFRVCNGLPLCVKSYLFLCPDKSLLISGFSL